MKCFDICWVVLFQLQLVSMGSISAYQCGYIFGTSNTPILGRKLEKAASDFLKVKTLTRWEGKGRWKRFCPLTSEPNDNFMLHVSTRVLQEYLSLLGNISKENENDIYRLCSGSLLNSCSCNVKKETEGSVKLYRLNERLCEVWNNFNNSVNFNGSEAFTLDIKKVKSLSVEHVVKVIKDFGKCLAKGQNNCESKVLKGCWRGRGSNRKWRGGKKNKKGQKGRRGRGRRQKQ